MTGIDDPYYGWRMSFICDQCIAWKSFVAPECVFKQLKKSVSTEEAMNAGNNEVQRLLNVLRVSRCPILNRVMTDPVILVASGLSYERTAISQHLLDVGTDPASGEQLTTEQMRLIANPAMKGMIVAVKARLNALLVHVSENETDSDDDDVMDLA
jgi:hypothetical protein